MKKITFLLATALGLGSFAAQNSAQATVNVKLFPFQSIMVNPNNQEVNLEFKKAEDYENGVSTDKKNHISVYAAGGFTVKVRAAAATLTSTQAGVDGNIASKDIHLTASAGTSNTLTDVAYIDAVSLTQRDQELFSSTTGGVNQKFNVNYTAKGDANKYVNKYFNVANPTVYTTTVTYSIEAR